MALPRTDVVEGINDGLSRFEDFIRSLSDEQWQTPTRCEGWAVADVAAHVVGNMAIIAEGRIAEFADPGHVDREVAARKGKSPADLADELGRHAKVGRDLVASFDDNLWSGPVLGADLPGTLGEGVEAIWYDFVVHTDDIRTALGMAPDLDRDSLRVAVSHIADVLTQQGYKPATVALDGIEEFPISGGGDDRITGDPYQFILVGTGRQDAASMGLDEAVNIYREQ